MDVSEFDSVAWTVLSELTSSSRSEKEAVPTCSRANVNCLRFSFAEEANSASCSVGKVLGSMCPSVAEEDDSVSGLMVEELYSLSGSEVEAVNSVKGSDVG